MGKNTKAPKVGAKAPEVEQPKNETKEFNEDFLKTLSPEQLKEYKAGLSPDKYVDLLKISHETFRMDPKASEHTGIPQKTIDSINKVTAAMQVSAIVCEVLVAKNPHNMILPEQIVQAMKLVGQELGVSLKENLLPAPDKDGNVVVPSTAIVVDKTVEAEVVEENKIVEEKPELDPQKIKTEQDLAKAAIFVLADTKTNVKPYPRITAAINLYYSWLYFQAADDTAKKELENTSKAVLFDRLTKIIGPCPFSMNGIAKIFFNVTSQTKSPISAFCALRNNSMDVKGHPTVDDALIADYVKVLVNWTAESKIKQDTESIETCKQNIELLGKDKKQNATAIKKEKEKISAYEQAIESYKEVISFVNQPTSHYADVLPSVYDDPQNDDYKTSRRLVGELFKSYFPGIDVKEVDHDCLLHNGQQYIGVVTNFFRDPMEQFKDYSEGNITELVMKKKDEEKKEEPEPKK